MSAPFQLSGHSLAAAMGSSMPGPKGPPLPMQEGVLVGFVTLNLVFMPWALGSMHVWSQLVSLALSAAALAVALLPRDAIEPAHRPWVRLLRFPIFWAGLLALIYIGVQGLNPSWRFVVDSRSWSLEPMHFNPHLPSGVDAPFSRSNPWRSAVNYASTWILVCSVWSGFLRRQSYRLTFGALVFSAAILALVGLGQQITGSDKIFWGYKAPEKAEFMASFIYRNHAGAYFNLMAALATGLAGWHLRRISRKLESPAAAVVTGFAAALIGIAVVFSASRMAIVLLVAFTLMISLGPVLGAVLEPAGRRRRRNWATVAIPLLSLLAIGFASLRADSVWRRFAALAASPSATLQTRTLAREAAGEMFRDRWVFGWGAGCFRYGFPLFSQHYPEIYLSPTGGRQYWEHAHDDLLEFPLELGVVGMIPIAAALGFACWRLRCARFWRNSLSLCAAVGCLLTLVHARFDFVFQNPAVMATWAVLLIGAIRWAELESAFERKRQAA